MLTQCSPIKSCTHFSKPYRHFSAFFICFRSNLVLSSRSLASLELIQIPAANGQAALVLIHALAEVVDVRGACTRLLRLRRGLVLLCEIRVLRRGLGGGGGRAA